MSVDSPVEFSWYRQASSRSSHSSLYSPRTQEECFPSTFLSLLPSFSGPLPLRLHRPCTITVMAITIFETSTHREQRFFTAQDLIIMVPLKFRLKRLRSLVEVRGCRLHPTKRRKIIPPRGWQYRGCTVCYATLVPSYRGFSLTMSVKKKLSCSTEGLEKRLESWLI